MFLVERTVGMDTTVEYVDARHYIVGTTIDFYKPNPAKRSVAQLVASFTASEVDTINGIDPAP